MRQANGLPIVLLALLIACADEPAGPGPDVIGPIVLSGAETGHNHTCALGNGSAYCWGDNSFGQLGISRALRTRIDDSGVELYGNFSMEPLRVDLPQDVRLTRIVAGSHHTCAEAEDGAAYCWGDSSHMQLGIWSVGESYTPVKVEAPAGVTLRRLVAGSVHTCAEGSDGSVYCWGWGNEGQLGIGSPVNFTTARRPVQSPPGVRLGSLALGLYHTCAEGSDGQVYCWGSSYDGQAGYPYSTSMQDRFIHLHPVAGPAGVRLSAPVAGSDHTCAEGSDGAVYCWGDNRFGQLGDGSAQDSYQPVAVRAPAGVTIKGLSASGTTTCGEGSDGRAYCWGYDSHTPAPMGEVPGESLTRVRRGASHMCARGAGVRPYCWGSNEHGQLGDGTQAGRALPTPVRNVIRK